MIIDCARLADGATIEADVCVIGSGPAGLSVASALAGTSINVVVIEAGGEPGKPSGLDAPAATMADSDFDAPPEVPHRFGGAANEWMVRLPNMRRGVRMLCLSPEDLDTRDWVPNSGWPIEWSELARWYRSSLGFLGLSDRGLDLDSWTDAEYRAMDLEPSGFTTAMEQIADPLLFTRSIYQDLQRSDNVDVYLGASAGMLDGPAHRATTLTLDHGRRDRLSVKAGTFVVACGGVPNAQILLQAREERGFGGSNQNAGAYYTDHHRVVTGMFSPADPDFRSKAGLYDLTHRHGAHVMGKIMPTAELRERHGLLHSGAMILPQPTETIAEGLGDFRRFAKRPWRGMNDPARALLSSVLAARVGATMMMRQRRIPPRVDAGWSGFSGAQFFGPFMVETQVELAPDPLNRVQLGATVNEFGRRDAIMTWRWTEADLTSLRRTTALLSKALVDSGMGTLTPTECDGKPEVTTPSGSFHPTGTTRMSASPSTGVVDSDGLVHGCQNVYVVGSSTFPTAGYANPTLTVVALARRLAASLKSAGGR